MSETNRNLRGIDKAGQKPLWKRSNPGQTAKANPVKDAKSPSSFPKPARKGNGLNQK